MHLLVLVSDMLLLNDSLAGDGLREIEVGICSRTALHVLATIPDIFNAVYSHVVIGAGVDGLLLVVQAHNELLLLPAGRRLNLRLLEF